MHDVNNTANDTALAPLSSQSTTESHDGSGNIDGNRLLSQIQNIFTIIYIFIYAFGLIGVSIYAIYKENKEHKEDRNDNSVVIHDKSGKYWISHCAKYYFSVACCFH